MPIREMSALASWRGGIVQPGDARKEIVFCVSACLRAGVSASKPCLLLVAVTLASLTFARRAETWSAHDHSLIAERALAAADSGLGLARPVPITPPVQFLARIAPLLGIAPTPAAFAQFLAVNPHIDTFIMAAGETPGGRAPPAQILAAHVNDPDDGRDKGVVDKPEARYMGGRDSQAFRHMEKPPVQWRDLTHTLGFPFGELGEASTRAQIYFDLARLSWQIGEPYWAWRWLACSLHYIQDLTQPYHTTQDASHGRLGMAILKVYLQTWGKKGLIGTAQQIVSNEHLFYEDLVTHYTQTATTGRPKDARALWLLEALQGDTAKPVPVIREYAKTVRDLSNRRAADLLMAVYGLSGTRLLSLYEYPGPDDAPEWFLKTEHDLDYLEQERRFFALTRDALQLAGDGTRTVVATFVAQRFDTPPPDLVATLRKMLAE